MTSTSAIQPYSPQQISFYQGRKLTNNFSISTITHAFSSVATVYFNNTHLCCGILVSSRRLVVPYHAIMGQDISKLKIIFQMGCLAHENLYPSKQYLVKEIVNVNSTLDYCVLKAKREEGHLPGCHFPIAQIGTRKPKTALLVHASMAGEKVLSIASPVFKECCSSHFLVTTETTEGSSGGIYFDEMGRAIAMHLGRSTGSELFCKCVRQGSTLYDFRRSARSVPTS